ncbi:DgyrCDS11506 [Dimorphilus gyrociliatus]|uniref:DgyrCDS11506 n=1 Tax=Dimorphilus gyrociliatus TaxID=2664684 RepID=A0A7I8W3J2_9ANNE|nr:DgyrCDS11506 [Dimorphilus gyrociliatus]
MGEEGKKVHKKTRRMEEAEEMKSIIRAILISAPHGQTFAELHKSYGELLHVRPIIPFKKIGYRSEVEYFEKNPDVGKLVFLNGIYLVYGQATKKDEQIAKLVRGQKTKKVDLEKRVKTEEKAARFRTRVNTGMEMRKNMRHEIRHKPTTFEKETTEIVENMKGKMVKLICKVEDSEDCNGPHKCFLKKSFVIAVRDMLIEVGPEDLPLRDFSEAFRLKFKRDLKLNTHRSSNVRELCEKMPEILHMYRKDGEILLKAVYVRIADDEGRGVLRRRYIVEEPIKSDPSSKVKVSVDEKQLRNKVLVNTSFDDSQDSDQEVKVSSETFFSSKASDSFSSSKLTHNFSLSSLGQSQFSLNSAESHSLLNESPPRTISESSFANETIQVNDQILPIEILENRMVEIVRSMTKVECLTVEEFCQAYKQRYDSRIYLEDYGCNSFRDLFKLAGNSLVIMIDLNDGREKICLNTKESYVQPQRKLKRVYCHFARDLPSDVPRIGTCYRSIKAPLPSKAESIYVEVSMVLNPSHFWLQIWGERTTVALKTLMDELEAFYTNSINREQYRMKNEDIVTGRCCVAYHEGDWQRGTVLDVKSTKVVSIYFVDYGEISSVEIKNVCHITTRFMQLQAQALRACLFGVKGVGGYWSKEAKEVFLNYVQTKVVFCGVRYVNDNNVIYCVIGDDKHMPVTDLLLEKKLAEITPRRMFDSGISETHFGAVEVIESPEVNSLNDENEYNIEIRHVNIGGFLVKILLTAIFDAELTSYISEKDLSKMITQETSRKLRKKFDSRTLVMSVERHCRILEKISKETGDSKDENFFYKFEDLPKIMIFVNCSSYLIKCAQLAYKDLHDKLYDDIDRYMNIIKSEQDIFGKRLREDDCSPQKRQKLTDEVKEMNECLYGFEEILSSELRKKKANERYINMQETPAEEPGLEITELDSTTETNDPTSSTQDSNLADLSMMPQRNDLSKYGGCVNSQQAAYFMNQFSQMGISNMNQIQHDMLKWNFAIDPRNFPFRQPTVPFPTSPYSRMVQPMRYMHY